MDFSFVETIYDPLLKKPIKRWVLELPGAGCEWYKKCGGCTMCGFNTATYQYTFGGKLYPNFIFMLFFYYAHLLVRNTNAEQLVIYNGGSFLNDKEIPRKTQVAIMKFVKKHPTIKKILVETRAEFVNQEKLALYKALLGDKKLEIALGLESADDEVRNKCLKKGLTKQTFEQAINLCQKYKAETFAYVFLKPPCLNEKEAIQDAINSIDYCFRVGVDEVSLSCAFIQENTLLHKLFQEGTFIPPNLWNIIEVIKQTSYMGPVRIGHFDDTPPPIAIPQNCIKCNDMVMATIESYRLSPDIHTFDNLDCECKNRSS